MILNSRAPVNPFAGRRPWEMLHPSLGLLPRPVYLLNPGLAEWTAAKADLIGTLRDAREAPRAFSSAYRLFCSATSRRMAICDGNICEPLGLMDSIEFCRAVGEAAE